MLRFTIFWEELIGIKAEERAEEIMIIAAGVAPKLA